MVLGLTLYNHVSFLLVFLEGIVSFFSPCVIPLIPIYMSYLAGHVESREQESPVFYERKIVFLHTFFFVLGISFAFLILGMSFTVVGKFFQDYKILFTRIGGVIIVFLGLFQLGIFDFSFLQKERKLSVSFAGKKMNPLLALLMGFTFSFAWTPCIGPALSSVLIMASGATASEMGYLLVFVYALGFLIPFLVLGLFTTRVLSFLKKRQKMLRYTVKVGAIILILMGIMTYTGWMNGVSGYLNSIGNNQKNQTSYESNTTPIETDSVSQDSVDSKESSESTEEAATQYVPEFDFTLTDQYGNTHTLSDYKGKVVFLNFWATWCPPCRKELPDIEKLYQEYDLNQEEVIFLGIVNPKSEDYPNNQDEDKASIQSFLEVNGYTFPTLFDETGEILQQYNISAFPTTFMINTEGNIVGYVPGMMTKDIMTSVIDQTKQGTIMN